MSIQLEHRSQDAQTQTRQGKRHKRGHQAANRAVARKTYAPKTELEACTHVEWVVAKSFRDTSL